MKNLPRFILFAALAPASYSQSVPFVLYTFNGDSPDDRFGSSVSGAGDVNGDGVPDLIVGAYRDDNNGLTDSGMARIFSGSDGSILYSLNGESACDGFGFPGAG